MAHAPESSITHMIQLRRAQRQSSSNGYYYDSGLLQMPNPNANQDLDQVYYCTPIEQQGQSLLHVTSLTFSP
jgi:hypothetical protein